MNRDRKQRYNNTLNHSGLKEDSAKQLTNQSQSESLCLYLCLKLNCNFCLLLSLCFLEGLQGFAWILLSCHLQPITCYLWEEIHANIIHDRGEAVCSTSATFIFNDVDFSGKGKQIRTQRGWHAVLGLPCR